MQDNIKDIKRIHLGIEKDTSGHSRLKFVNGVAVTEASPASDTPPTYTQVAENGGAQPSLIKVTYEQLVSKINGSQLVPNAKYLITDFQTTHFIVDSDTTQYISDINTGPVEPLMVTAVSTNKIGPEAQSTVYPQDVICYDWDPNNWLGDRALSNLTLESGPVIVTGFKGVIYRRHDMLQDNLLGYDFRAVKFRRWKVNPNNWLSNLTYNKGDVVWSGNYYFQCLQTATSANYPAFQSPYWALFLADAEVPPAYVGYYSPSPTFFNSIINLPVGTSFIDVLTFQGALPSDYQYIRNNNFEAYRDTAALNSANGSIMTNNVFYVAGEGWGYSVYSNIAGQSFTNNTLIGHIGDNDFGNGFVQNTVSDNMSDNKFLFAAQGNLVGPNFSMNVVDASFTNNLINMSVSNNQFGSECFGNVFGFGTAYNTFGHQAQNNTIAQFFQKNTTGPGFVSNVVGQACTMNSFGSYATNNIIGDNFQGNNAKENFQSNTLGSGLNGNEFGAAFSSNTLADNCYKNSFGPGCNNNHLGAFSNSNIFMGSNSNIITSHLIADSSLQANTFEVNFGGVDFTNATLIYQPYGHTLFVNSAGNPRLRYYDDADVLHIVSCTT